MFAAALNMSRVSKHLGPYELKAGRWSEIPSNMLEYLDSYPDGEVVVVKKENPQHSFLVMSGAKFHTTGGGQHPTQITKELSEMGHRVAFMQDVPIPTDSEGYPMVTVYPDQDIRYNSFSKYSDAFWSKKPLSQNEVKDYVRWAQEWASMSGGPRVAVVCCPTPYFIAVAEGLQGLGWAVIYWCLDDWNAFQDTGEVQWYRPEYQDCICSMADGVIATAGELSKQLGGCLQIGNGWNHRVFGHDVRVKTKKKPNEGLVVGYWGYLHGSWFDWSGVEEMARTNPTWEVRIIGGLPFDTVPETTRLLMYSNVKFLGEVPNADLPSYAAEFDVAIIPFKVDAVSEAVNPIKVYEYLASGIPVVSSYMPDLDGMPGVYLYGKDGNRTADYIGKAIAYHYHKNFSKINWGDVKEFLATRSWKGRTESFIDYLEELGVLP